MLIKGDSGDINVEEGLQMIRMSNNQGCKRSEQFLNIYDKMKMKKSFLKFPFDMQLFFICNIVENGKADFRFFFQKSKIYN